MSDVQENPVYAHVGGPDGLKFEFEKVYAAEQFDFMGDGAEAFALVMNHRANIARLKESDLPAQYKNDVKVVSEMAIRERFIEQGVPAHLMTALEAMFRGFEYDID
jgi:hypothetical protein